MNALQLKYLLYAILLYVPTIVHMRVEFYLLAILAVVFFERDTLLANFQEFKKDPFNRRYWTSIWLILLILILSLANKIFFGHKILCLKDYYSAFYLFPLLILVSRFFGRQEVFRFLLILTGLEIGIGCLEYMEGVRSFFIELGDYNFITNKSLLYDSRSYGLSANSSIFGYKVLIGFILVELCQLKKHYAWGVRTLLLIGLLLSFSRTVIIVLIVFWCFRLIVGSWKSMKDKMEIRQTSFLFSLVMILFISVFSDEVVYQLSRGDHQAETAFTGDGTIEKHEAKSCGEVHALDFVPGQLDPANQGWGDKLMLGAGNVQSSGRKLIWINYINYIQGNLLTGNGSDKLMFRSWNIESESYKLVHAHNSYFQLIATNGIIITLMYLVFYLFQLKSRNYILLFTVLLYSMGNYGIFWGFSYLDVVFIILLSVNLKSGYDYQGEVN